MKRHVRLIGGAAHGKVVEVDRDQTDYAHATLANVRGYSRVDAIAPETATADVKIEHYTRRVVCTPRGDVLFFAPREWSDFQAINRVLGP